ncbi:MAG: hypothetical protein IKT20_05900 [Clostridiales bacterium]|nr:hypothetical protein [Clostridiales bacterium]
MANNIKYIAKYQKENTLQINIRLSKKYDADVIEKLNSLDNTGKSTYIKRLIREDIARANGEVPEEDYEGPEEQDEPSAPISEEKCLSAVELAVTLGTSENTINSWYRWKRENPEHEYAKRLPDFFRVGAHRSRRWHLSDVPKLIEFKNSLPQGRNGIMGSVTQRYYKDSRWYKGNAA